MEAQIPFKEILRRLIGVYVILQFFNKHDEIGGILTAVTDDGKITLRLQDEIYTHIDFIEYVIIPHQEGNAERASPLTRALNARLP